MKKSVLQPGDKVKMLENYPTAKIKYGDIETIESWANAPGDYRIVKCPRYIFPSTVLEKVVTKFTRAKILKEKSDLVVKLAETEAKLAFLDEIGTDDGDEKEFKVFATLSMIENGDMTIIQKAQAIAALIT